MELILHQLILMIRLYGCGIIAAFSYDCMKICELFWKKGSYKDGRWVNCRTFEKIADILYWLVWGITMARALFLWDNGTVRLYEMIGFFAGYLQYRKVMKNRLYSGAKKIVHNILYKKLKRMKNRLNQRLRKHKKNEKST